MEPLYSGQFRTREDCREYRSVLISGAEDVLRLITIVNHLVSWHVFAFFEGYISAIQGYGLEGFNCNPIYICTSENT